MALCPASQVLGLKPPLSGPGPQREAQFKLLQVLSTGIPGELSLTRMLLWAMPQLHLVRAVCISVFARICQWSWSNQINMDNNTTCKDSKSSFASVLRGWRAIFRALLF